MDSTLHQPERPPRHLLLVDDEDSILQSLRRMLRRDGYVIHLANGGEAGLAVLEKEPIGVIVTDQRMPGMTGSDFLGLVKEKYPETIRIVLSGYTELNSITDAINKGAIYKFLTKPWDDDLLRAHIAEAFSRYELKHENARLAAFNKAIVEANPEGLLLVDAGRGEIVTTNAALNRLLGYPDGALAGRPVSDIEPLPLDHCYWEEILGSDFRALESVETEYLRADGELIPVSKSTADASGGQGRRVLVLVHDLSHQRRIEHSLERLNAELASVFEATLDGVLVLDEHRHLARMNRRLTQILGLPDAVMGSRDGEAILRWIAAQSKAPETTEQELLAHFQTPESRSNGQFDRSGGDCIRWYASPQNVDGDIIGHVFVFSVSASPEIWDAVPPDA